MNKYIQRRPNIRLFWFCVLMALAAICLASCRTTKNKATTKFVAEVAKTVDSSKTKTEEKVAVKKGNTVSKTDSKDDYSRVTVVDFHTPKIIDPKSITRTDPGDYFQPVKKITITEKGLKNVKTTIVANNSDSTKTLKTETTDLVKTENTNVENTEIVKNKVTTNHWGWVGIVIIVAGIWYIGYRFGLWRWFIALFRRKKDEYEVKYKRPDSAPNDKTV